MALVKSTLATAIKSALDSAYAQAVNPEADNEAIKTNFSNAIADAFDDYVKTAQLTLPAGSIQVQGTAAAQSNGTPLIIPTALS